uniref:acyltransferase n=1 Tax=Thaumasiovibrio occultus TaxID=1891184 RepID=UPI000B356CD7|nr:acyltransferase [Thaumasiovibrio occultus]
MGEESIELFSRNNNVVKNAVVANTAGKRHYTTSVRGAKVQRQKVDYIDLMRCVAAIAVVAIHVLGPYRHEIGVISTTDWSVATTVNAASRWAVPLFIMISGALMLSDRRPFELNYYVRRRLGKVLVPFLVWSVFYALLSGVSLAGWNGSDAWQRLIHLPTEYTYYHLGFFYYFLPLYLVIPFLRYWVSVDDRQYTWALAAWWGLITLNLLRIDGWWSQDLLFYSGYLLLGYSLFRAPLLPARWWALLGGIIVVLTALMVILPSLEAQRYLVGRWLSYKTVNTAFIAVAVFAACRHGYPYLSESLRKGVSEISRCSLGIYLVHPLLLWPVREFNWYLGPSWLMIVWWTCVITGLSWLLTRVLMARRITAWLVP